MVLTQCPQLHPDKSKNNSLCWETFLSALHVKPEVQVADVNQLPKAGYSRSLLDLLHLSGLPAQNKLFVGFIMFRPRQSLVFLHRHLLSSVINNACSPKAHSAGFKSHLSIDKIYPDSNPDYLRKSGEGQNISKLREMVSLVCLNI